MLYRTPMVMRGHHLLAAVALLLPVVLLLAAGVSAQRAAQGAADLGVVLTTSSLSGLLGSGFTLTAVITNSGAAASAGDKNMMLTLPSGVTPTGPVVGTSAADCTFSGSTEAGWLISCTISGTLAQGESWFFTIPANTSTPGNKVVTVTVSAVDPDINPSNNTSTTFYRAFINCGAPFGLLGDRPACPAGTVYTGPDDEELQTEADFATDCCSAVPAEGECTRGICCDIAKKKFHPKGQLCRRAQGSCDADSTCTGNSTDCPRVVAPNGKPCAYTSRDHNDFFWPLAADPATDAALSRRPEKNGGDPSYQADSGLDRFEHRQQHYKPAHKRPGHKHGPTPYHPADPPSYGEPSQPYYPAEGPSYRNNRRDDPRSGYGGYGWPECWGTCEAGECQLDQSVPGCCHLSAAQHGSYGGQGYASAADVGGDSADGARSPVGGSPATPGGTTGAVGGEAATSADSGSSSGLAGPLYKREEDSSLVCWKGEGLA